MGGLCCLGTGLPGGERRLDADGQKKFLMHRSAALHGKNRIEHRAATTESSNPC